MRGVLTERLERVEDHVAGDVEPLRRVVHLMERAPHEGDVVASAVIAVREELDGEKPHERAAGDAELRTVEDAMSREPFDADEDSVRRGHGREFHVTERRAQPRRSGRGLCAPNRGGG